MNLASKEVILQPEARGASIGTSGTASCIPHVTQNGNTVRMDIYGISYRESMDIDDMNP